MSSRHQDFKMFMFQDDQDLNRLFLGLLLSWSADNQESPLRLVLIDRKTVFLYAEALMEGDHVPVCPSNQDPRPSVLDEDYLMTRPLRSNMRRPQKCSICSGRTLYCYYNAIVCDPCRTFFRRQVLNKKVRFHMSQLEKAYPVFFTDTLLPFPEKLHHPSQSTEELCMVSI